MKILVIGIPSEPPLELVHDQLLQLGAPIVMFNQRHVAQYGLDVQINEGRVDGRLRIDGEQHALSSFRGVFVRPMDDTQLPEVRGLPVDHPDRVHCRNVHDLLMRWLDIAPGRVVNRPQPMGSNMSKPFQAQLIRRCGIDVPETLVANDPGEVLAFRRRHGRIIYKSISGVRSIVQELGDHDLERLERTRHCPTQFQQYIAGTNVRVHTVGKEAFATRAESNVLDYRYAARQEGETQLEAFDLPHKWRQRCAYLSGQLGLDFSGIDLKITPEGRVYCFEVNPCPAFSYYEMNTGQPIARAVARYLCGTDELKDVSREDPISTRNADPMGKNA